MEKSTLSEWKINGARIIVRADLNGSRGPNGEFFDDFRLKALCPTLSLIIKKGGLITLIGHSGRPTKKSSDLSLFPLCSWLEKKGFTVTFAQDIDEAKRLSKKTTAQILLVENIRFFPEETNCDLTFAQELAQLGTYFVQDAFGSLHRSSASISVLHSLFAVSRKSIGLLVEEELKNLSMITNNPPKPFTLIIGGNKPETKIPLIKKLLDHVSTILLCPPLVFTFLKTSNIETGRSLIDDTQWDNAVEIINEAKKRGITLVTPLDYLVTTGTIEKPFPLSTARTINSTQIGISVGPETIALFKRHITNARTILFNGAPGLKEHPETLEASRCILQALQLSNAQKVIAGGDTVALAHYFKYSDHTTFFSTGGGSTLAYLTGETLPGLW